MNLLNVYKWLLNHLSAKVGKACFFCETKIPALNNGLCNACLDDFPINRHACERCGINLPHTIYSAGKTPQIGSSQTDISLTNTAHTKTYLCGDCIATPPAWHTLTALCQYEYPASNMIQALKYNAKFNNAKLLASMFIAELRSMPQLPLPQCLLPVPLHPVRQQQRGFNQAIELARPIARTLGIPLDIHSCIRRADTPSQANLDKLTRLINLQDAFTLKRSLSYKHVTIFDDVVTTGSTVRSLCKLLHNAGVERVDVWCIARASK